MYTLVNCLLFRENFDRVKLELRNLTNEYQVNQRHLEPKVS